MKIINKLSKYGIMISVVIGIFLSGCQEEFLDKQPTDQLSDATFWKDKKDAKLALTGIYHEKYSLYSGHRHSFWQPHTLVKLDATTDIGYEKDDMITRLNTGSLEASYYVIKNFWESSYDKIARCNNFLDNIQKPKMDEEEKAEMIAEVKFIRAYYYFWMSQLWGGVPLVTEILTLEEANSVTRASKADVVNFVLDELNAAAQDLPETRPDDEHGRIIKAAALAIKGRLLMSEEQWSEAANTYEEIINMGIFAIDPLYKELFEDEAEMSDEIIMSFKVKQKDLNTRMQVVVLPFMYGGWHLINVYRNLVVDYGMKDGKTIENSPLYNPSNPFENRDPRLEMSVFYPEQTVFRGRLYVAHPDSAGADDRLPRRDWSGYALKKFADEDYEGSPWDYGGDFPVIRYAEVLLSYLESKLEAGDNIDQNLLDQTINKIRGREAVDMPSVTETNTSNLRPILRRERKVELAFEGLRYFDLLRWGIAHEELNDKFYGMKITDNPENYEGQFEINEGGFVFCKEYNFREDVDYLWPIPQDEIDINPNLEQNPGY